MIGQVIDCARESCGQPFSKGTHNQKYCTNECCRIETNRKIMEKYHERAAIRRGKKRVCNLCQTSLSRYNEFTICGACETTKRGEVGRSTAELVASVIWL